MNTHRSVRIGVIGSAGLDQSGSLTGAARLAMLIQQAGGDASFFGLVDRGSRGASIKERLAAEGVDIAEVAISDSPAISLGDPIDIAKLFAMDAALIAVPDFKLHRFLVDLPAHTAPNARLIGLLGFLAARPTPEALEVALLHDLVIAATVEIQALTGIADEPSAIDEMQARMTGVNLRTAAIVAPSGHAAIVTKTERFSGVAEDFDRFAARVAVQFADRSPWQDVFKSDGPT